MLPTSMHNGMVLKAIVFLSDHEIVLGSPNFLKEILDTRAGAKKNILSDPLMASLIGAIPSGEMLWFAGKSPAVLAKAPVPVPVGMFGPSIKSVSGVFSVTDATKGKIAITTVNAGAAEAVVKFYAKMATAAQILEEEDAGLKLLAGGRHGRS